jgi:hypothetical protein
MRREGGFAERNEGWDGEGGGGGGVHGEEQEHSLGRGTRRTIGLLLCSKP